MKGRSDCQRGCVLWFTEVAGVAVCCKDHVAGMVCDDGFFLRGKIIKEL